MKDVKELNLDTEAVRLIQGVIIDAALSVFSLAYDTATLSDTRKQALAEGIARVAGTDIHARY